MRSEIEFISLANQAGIQVTPGRRLPWLTNKGHLAESLRGVVPVDVLELLGALFRSLGGDEAALRAKRAGSDPCPDMVFEERGWLVEYDEQQHFTSDRLVTFDRYPTDVDVAYDIDAYRASRGVCLGRRIGTEPPSSRRTSRFTAAGEASARTSTPSATRSPVLRAAGVPRAGPDGTRRSRSTGSDEPSPLRGRDRLRMGWRS